jgi:hypothetical protein
VGGGGRNSLKSLAVGWRAEFNTRHVHSRDDLRLGHPSFCVSKQTERSANRSLPANVSLHATQKNKRYTWSLLFGDVTHHWLVVTGWFKYDRDKLWLVYTQSVPVVFEPPCTYRRFEAGWGSRLQGSTAWLLNMGPRGSLETSVTTSQSRITSQMSEDLLYTAAEASSFAALCCLVHE